MEKGNTRRDFLQVVMAGSLISVPAGVLMLAPGNSPGSKGTYGHKDYLMNKTICSIYDERPKICRQFPVHAGGIKGFNKCTFSFDGKVRKGDCCSCGQCCVSMPFSLPPPENHAVDVVNVVRSKAESHKIYFDKVCRHLINGD